MPHLPIEDRRRQFIEATSKVLASEGVARATTRRIAEAAGAPAASLHYCFDTKEELFQAVFEQGSADGIRIAGRDVRPGMGLHDAVAVILRGYLSWILRDREMQQAQYELVLWALRSPGSRHLPARTYRAYIESTARLLREACGAQETGVNLDLLARRIIALLDGHNLQWMALDDDSMTDVVEDAIVELQVVLAASRPSA